jgi:hypothetical protein
MSQPNIRNALENALRAMAPAVDIVFENTDYAPIEGVPYIECFMLYATPGNPTMGDGFFQEIGILQANLMYPAGVGTLDAATRAELIRAAFKRGATFTDGGITVQIDKTPEIPGGKVEDGRWKVILRAPFHADTYI